MTVNNTINKNLTSGDTNKVYKDLASPPLYSLVISKRAWVKKGLSLGSKLGVNKHHMDYIIGFCPHTHYIIYLFQKGLE